MIKWRSKGGSIMVLALVAVLFASGCGTKTAEKPIAKPPTTGAEQPAPQPKPQPLRKLKVNYSAAVGMMVPLWLGVDKGVFNKYGLDVELVLLNGGAAAAKAVLSGDTPIGLFSEGSVVDSRLEGADLISIAAGFERFYFYIYAKPGVTSLEMLKGKTIAGTRPGSATDFAVREALGKAGLVQDRDYQMAWVGSNSGMVGALTNGVVDAAVLPPPFGLELKKAGFVEVTRLFERADLPFGYGTVGVSQKWAKENPEIVRDFLKAYVEGIKIAKENKPLAKELIGKYMQLTDDALMEEAYITIVPLLPDRPFPKEATVSSSIKLSVHPKAPGAKPSDFIDASFMQALEKEGFLDKLLGR